MEACLGKSKKYISLGPDGWTSKFFLTFLDKMCEDLLRFINEIRKKVRIISIFNSTFIVLILKKFNPKYFGDFRPLYLCNSLYKLISNIIVERLKTLLTPFISHEQFGFLADRNIHEVVGTSKERMHSIICKKIKVKVIKIDLAKDYDRSSWLYIRHVMI